MYSFSWQVYYISKGKLKPANKKFSSIKNDYELTLGQETVVEEVGGGWWVITTAVCRAVWIVCTACLISIYFVFNFVCSVTRLWLASLHVLPLHTYH